MFVSWFHRPQLSFFTHRVRNVNSKNAFYLVFEECIYTKEVYVYKVKNLITLCNKMRGACVYGIFSIILLSIFVTNAQYDNYGGGYDDPQNSGSVPIGEFFFSRTHTL